MVTREHSQLNLEDIMIPDPFVVTPETPVSQVVAVMMEEKYGCAIVQKNEELVGIFTTIDALRILKGLL
jgi:acetoin utilization protein AcuB